jgi:hypothetical protein
MVDNGITIIEDTGWLPDPDSIPAGFTGLTFGDQYIHIGTDSYDKRIQPDIKVSQMANRIAFVSKFGKSKTMTAIKGFVNNLTESNACDTFLINHTKISDPVLYLIIKHDAGYRIFHDRNRNPLNYCRGELLSIDGSFRAKEREWLESGIFESKW